MRRVRYGVGMSLDGFIADVDDATGWMTGDPGYDSKPFLESVDTVLVGRRSYEVMLRHGVRAYPGLPTYVFSRTLKAAEYPEVTWLAENSAAAVAGLRGGSGKDIWLSGGGELFTRGERRNATRGCPSCGARTPRAVGRTSRARPGAARSR